jgi:hypothetical protein
MPKKYFIETMNDLADALEEFGFSSKDVEKLSNFPDLGCVRDILNGQAIIVYPKHVINLDSPPLVLEKRSLKEHRGKGLFKFSPSAIKLAPVRVGKGTNQGLHLWFLSKRAINANVLDYLLSHQELIPERWKGLRICFPGTTYVDKSDFTSVRALFWHRGEKMWKSCEEWLGSLVYDETTLFAYFG